MTAEKDKTLKDIWDKLDENQKLLEEVARWSRFQNIGRLKEVLAAELDTDEKKLVFEYIDGMKGIKDISHECGAPQDTIYGWWKKWSRLGILEPSDSREGRLVKICSLEDVGIKIPKTIALEKEAALQKEVVQEKASGNEASNEKAY